MKFVAITVAVALSCLAIVPANAATSAAATTPKVAASIGATFSAYPQGREAARVSTPVSVGNLLVAKRDLTVTGIRFWKASRTDIASRTALVSTSDGTVLRRVALGSTSLRRTGWVSASFATPITVTAGQSVIASVSSPKGWVVRTRVAPASTSVRAVAGLYAAGSGRVPTARKNGYFYVVDLLVAPAAVIVSGPKHQDPIDQPTPQPTATPTPTPTPTVSPTPTATPVPTGTPTDTPSSTPSSTPSQTTPMVGFPTRNNVGWQVTGATLRPYDGPNEITQDGTVIDGADITVPLIVSANNVTIMNSRITSPTAWYVIRQYPEFSHLTLENVELVNQSGEHPDWAIFAGPYLTVNRSLIHGMQRGIYASPNMTVTNSYLDDFDNPSTSHAQAILTSGNVHNVTLTNNTFGCGTNMCTAALSIFPETWTGGPNSNWTIDHNLLNGGSYALYAGDTDADGESPNTNMTFTNNVFGDKYFATSGEFGYVGSWSVDPSNVWANNTNASGDIVLP
jgi:Domain of unknown function (DUF4082)